MRRRGPGEKKQKYAGGKIKTSYWGGPSLHNEPITPPAKTHLCIQFLEGACQRTADYLATDHRGVWASSATVTSMGAAPAAAVRAPTAAELRKMVKLQVIFLPHFCQPDYPASVSSLRGLIIEHARHPSGSEPPSSLKDFPARAKKAYLAADWAWRNGALGDVGLLRAAQEQCAGHLTRAQLLAEGLPVEPVGHGAAVPNLNSTVTATVTVTGAELLCAVLREVGLARACILRMLRGVTEAFRPFALSAVAPRQPRLLLEAEAESIFEAALKTAAEKVAGIRSIVSRGAGDAARYLKDGRLNQALLASSALGVALAALDSSVRLSKTDALAAISPPAAPIDSASEPGPAAAAAAAPADAMPLHLGEALNGTAAQLGGHAPLRAVAAAHRGYVAAARKECGKRASGRRLCLPWASTRALQEAMVCLHRLDFLLAACVECCPPESKSSEWARSGRGGSLPDKQLRGLLEVAELTEPPPWAARDGKWASGELQARAELRCGLRADDAALAAEVQDALNVYRTSLEGEEKRLRAQFEADAEKATTVEAMTQAKSCSLAEFQVDASLDFLGGFARHGPSAVVGVEAWTERAAALVGSDGGRAGRAAVVLHEAGAAALARLAKHFDDIINRRLPDMLQGFHKRQGELRANSIKAFVDGLDKVTDPCMFGVDTAALRANNDSAFADDLKKLQTELGLDRLLLDAEASAKQTLPEAAPQPAPLPPSEIEELCEASPDACSDSADSDLKSTGSPPGPSPAEAAELAEATKKAGIVAETKVLMKEELKTRQQQLNTALELARAKHLSDMDLKMKERVLAVFNPEAVAKHRAAGESAAAEKLEAAMWLECLGADGRNMRDAAVARLMEKKPEATPADTLRTLLAAKLDAGPAGMADLRGVADEAAREAILKGERAVPCEPRFWQLRGRVGLGVALEEANKAVAAKASACLRALQEATRCTLLSAESSGLSKLASIAGKKIFSALWYENRGTMHVDGEDVKVLLLKRFQSAAELRAAFDAATPSALRVLKLCAADQLARAAIVQQQQGAASESIAKPIRVGKQGSAAKGWPLAEELNQLRANSKSSDAAEEGLLGSEVAIGQWRLLCQWAGEQLELAHAVLRNDFIARRADQVAKWGGTVCCVGGVVAGVATIATGGAAAPLIALGVGLLEASGAAVVGGVVAVAGHFGAVQFVRTSFFEGAIAVATVEAELEIAKKLAQERTAAGNIR